MLDAITGTAGALARLREWPNFNSLRYLSALGVSAVSPFPATLTAEQLCRKSRGSSGPP